MRTPCIFSAIETGDLIAGVFALDERLAATDRANPFARHDAALLVDVFESLSNFDRSIALVCLAPLSNLLFQFRMLLGVLGFLLGALGAIFRGLGFFCSAASWALRILAVFGWRADSRGNLYSSQRGRPPRSSS